MFVVKKIKEDHKLIDLCQTLTVSVPPHSIRSFFACWFRTVTPSMNTSIPMTTDLITHEMFEDLLEDEVDDEST